MQIEGKPLLSRATMTAGRTLCASAILTILVDVYAIELTDLKILGVGMDASNLAKPAFWLLLFIAIGYFINWFGDVFTFRGWNERKNRTGFGYFGEGGGEFQGEVDTALQKVSQTTRRIEMLVEAEKVDERLISELMHLTKEATSVLGSVKKNSWRIGTLGWIILFIWHGLVPLVLSAWALRILVMVE